MSTSIRAHTLRLRSPLDYYARPSSTKVENGNSPKDPIPGNGSAFSKQSAQYSVTDEKLLTTTKISHKPLNGGEDFDTAFNMEGGTRQGGGPGETNRGLSSKDGDGGLREHKEAKLRSRQSQERTRTWAEEIERRRPREGRPASNRNPESSASPQAGISPLPTPIPKADAPNSSISSVCCDSSSGEESGPLGRRASKASQRNRRRLDLVVPIDRSTPSLDSSSTSHTWLSPTKSSPPAQITTPISSIDDIVKRHQYALTSAMDSAKTKARLEMGLSPASLDIQSLDRQSSISSSSHSACSLPAVNGTLGRDPSNVEPAAHRPPSASTAASAATALSPTQAFFMGETSGRSRQSIPRTMLDFELAHSTEEVDAETSTRSLTVKAEPRDSEGSSCDSLVKDLWIGQKLLQQLDEGSSTPSDPTLLHQERLSMDALSNPPSLKRHSVRLSKSSDSPESHAMAVYLRSPNLNRHLQLPRPYPDRPLNVSLAEVGSASGSPVLIFLGIGCVRYLIALFDDLAKALDLRLICIDRWGYGKTDPVPTDRRSPMLWAQVVEKVMDELKIRDFRIIAHSAGAPFAAAVALRLGNRITGKMQFLAPWVSPEIDGGYKWLKWIPNGVIKSATAAEWRLQSYLLGKPPPLVHQPVEHTAEGLSLPTPSPGRPSIGQRAHSDTGAKVEPRRSLLSSPSPVPSRAPSIIRRASSVFAKNHTAPVQDKDLKRQPIIKHLRSSVLLRSHSEDDGRSPFKAISPRGSSDFSSSVPVSEKHSLTIKSEVFSASYEGDILEFLTDGFSLSGLPATPSPTPSKNRFSVLSPLPSPFRQSSTPTTRSTSPIRSGIDVQDEPKPSLGPALTQALMQASHAECEPGTTTEILTVVLNRGEKPWGFSYADLRQPVTIHWGELDDKVSEKSVRWMERNMNQGGGATVQIIKGEGHNLMTNAVVMCDIFQALRKEVKEERADAERGVKERVMMSRSRRR